MMRRFVGAWMFGAALGGAAPARAQALPMVGPVYGPPRVSWIGPPGDASGTPGATEAILEPIRVGLVSMTRPIVREPGCDAVESAGSATATSAGHARQYASAIQLVPRLTLFGFSRAGCPLESSIGAAAVYAVPVRRDIFLTGSAGLLYLPHNGPGGSGVRRMQLRGDVVFTRPGGRSISVGVGFSGPTMLTLGGLL
ncbi:MAG: hypothetical protein KF819_09045 [Labilithrix sp.]|nr:hypothetical protein [Labilithrix sp.]